LFAIERTFGFELFYCHCSIFRQTWGKVSQSPDGKMIIKPSLKIKQIERFNAKKGQELEFMIGLRDRY